MNDPKRTSSPDDDEPPPALEQAGTHPLGTAAGAVAGAAVGAVGGLAAGPVGSLAGAVGGAIAGAAIGSGGTRAAPATGPRVRAEDPAAGESVAGEEDPGASVDLAVPAGGVTPANPGDLAPAGTPGTGEAVCARCGGSGRIGVAPCPDCSGTGKVIQGIGGA